HFHLRDRARVHVEAVRAGDALAIEQAVEREHAVLRLRAYEPEIGERRKLLALLRSGIESETARGESVALIAAEQAEVRGAEEHDELILVCRRVQRVVHTKTGKPRLRRQLPRRAELAPLEHRGAVQDGPHARLAHLRDVHAL